MELIGYDNDLRVSGRADAVMAEFLRQVARRWPRMRAQLWDKATNESVPLPATGVHPDYPLSGCISVVRNRRMAAHLRRRGGVPMRDGEGPLLLWFWGDPDGGCALDLITPADARTDPFSQWAVAALEAAVLAS